MGDFNRVAGRYDDWYKTPQGEMAHAVEKEVVMGITPVGKGNVVLDLGCGTGIYSIELAKQGCRVTGFDCAAAMLAKGRAKAEATAVNIDWVQGDFKELPFATGTFDMVLSVTALEFAPDPRGVLLEAMRVLKPGGSLVVGVLALNSPWGRAYQEEGRQNPASVIADVHLYEEEELKALLPYCRELRRGLFFPPTDKFDAAAAAAQEMLGRSKEHESVQERLEAGFLAARWEKPVAGGPPLACQLTLYALGMQSVGEVIRKALRTLDSYPVTYEVGTMSTVIRGSADAVWTAVRALSDRAMESGLEAVVQANVSNRCGCRD